MNTEDLLIVTCIILFVPSVLTNTTFPMFKWQFNIVYTAILFFVIGIHVDDTLKGRKMLS